MVIHNKWTTMTDEKKVSIITISYNAEAYIERTIKSVIGQSYSNVEYIIIDGASTDGTLDIIKKYENHIDVCVSEPDKNLYDAMNKGLGKATGDYVVFMNSGDCIHAMDSLEKMMKGNPNADLVYGKAVYVNESGGRRPWHKKTPLPNKINAKSFMNGMVVCHQCMLVKRTIAPLYELDKWKIANDIDWSIRVMKNVETAHFYDDIFCDFLEGGVSNEQRKWAIRDRFKISVSHFGLSATLLEQVKIVFQAIRRGSIK